MKKIMMILMAIIVLNTILLGNQEFQNMVQKAIPFGWKVGETTCQDIEKEFPLLRTWKMGTRRYGIEDKIAVSCNRLGFRNKFSHIVFYTDKSFSKLGFNRYMSHEEVKKYFLKYFKESQIVNYEEMTNVELNDFTFNVIFKDKSKNHIEAIEFILDHNQF